MATLSTPGLLLCSLLESSQPPHSPRHYPLPSYILNPILYPCFISGYLISLSSPPHNSTSQSHNRLISPSQPESSPESNSSPHHNPRHHPLPHPTYIIIPTRHCHRGRQRPNYALPFPPCLQDRKDIVNDDRMGNLNELITSSAEWPGFDCWSNTKGCFRITRGGPRCNSQYILLTFIGPRKTHYLSLLLTSSTLLLYDFASVTEDYTRIS